MRTQNGGIKIRLWLVHPKYLDPKGLRGQWYEGIILRNRIKDGKAGNYPGFEWIIESSQPLAFMNAYLKTIYIESKLRDCNYNLKFVEDPITDEKTPLPFRELLNDFVLLRERLIGRNSEYYSKTLGITWIDANPVFEVVE